MKKTILIAVYNLEIGGIERSLINMLENFDYNRFTVDLLIYHHTGEYLGLVPKQVTILPQIDQYSLFRKPVLTCFKEGYFSIPAARVASKAVAAAKAKRMKLNEGSGYIQMQLALKYACPFLPKQDKTYDLAISYAWPHDIVAQKIKARKKVAWVHTDYGKLEIDHKLDLKVWEQFDIIAAVSDECAQSFLNQYPTLTEKMIVMENITSPAFIKRMARENGQPMNEKTFNLVSVGRLSYVKGFDLAVEALRILHDKGLRDLKWYVVGYGGYESELNRIIQKHELTDHFILLGKKTNPYPYFHGCDVYVQPSRYEGKAVTVTEAMILGKPILITNYPTAKSQVKDGVDGIICDVSAAGIAEGIEKLYQSKELRESLMANIRGKDYSNSVELEKLYHLVD